MAEKVSYHARDLIEKGEDFVIAKVVEIHAEKKGCGAADEKRRQDYRDSRRRTA